MSYAVIVPATVLALLLAGSHALLRYSAGLSASVMSWPRVGFVGAALLVYIAIFFYYSILLERLPLSRLYPIYTGLSVVLVYVAGIVFFNEHMSIRGAAGVLLVILGVVMVVGK